jgi:olfactory receptor
MKTENHTGESQFLLFGLSDDPELQLFLFGLFSRYLATTLGNMLIILTTSSDTHLHTPMYFFLCKLSFVDICFISTTVPKMLVNIQTHNKDISYRECLTQVYFSNMFAGTGKILLTLMAYDRFVAICYPLNYTVIMNTWPCGFLVLLSWIIILCVFLIHILLMKHLSFSINTEISHFCCQLAPLFKVARSNTFINNIFMYLMTALLGVLPIVGILFPYVQIVSTLMRMSSIVRKYKALSTCGYHLGVVTLFYRTALVVYLSSAMTHSSQGSTLAVGMYTVVTPMLNCFMYSLRNKDVKDALGKLLRRGL